MHRDVRSSLGSALVVATLAFTACHGRRQIAVSPAAPMAAQPAATPSSGGPTPGELAAKAGDVVIVSRRPVPTAAEPGAAAPPASPMPAPAAAPSGEPAAPAGEAGPEAGPGALLGDVRLRSAVERDKVQFVVQQKLQSAKDEELNGNYAAAERLLLDAQELDPTNTDVRTELRLVQAYLGRRSATAGDFLETVRQVQKVRIDEQRTTASKLVNLARQNLQGRRYDDAIDNFEQALFIITSSPYDVDWGGLKEQAEQGLRNAKQMKQEAQRAEHRASVESSLENMAQAEEQRLLAEQQQLERLMGSAIEAFDRDDFEHAEFYAGKVLDVQPDNTKARDLQLAARRAHHDQVEGDYLIEEKRHFREWMDDIEATRIPQDKILKWPSQSFWDHISEVRRATRASFGAVEVDPEADALRAKLRTTTVNLQVQDQPFEDVVKLLSIQTGINLTIDARIKSDIGQNPVASLQAEDLPLSTVLDLLKQSAGEDAVWTVKGNVVLFTNKTLLKPPLTVQLHDAADLTTGLPDFIPPNIQIVNPDMVSDEEHPLFGAEGEEPRLPYGTIDELIELIKGAVEPKFWDETEGAEIRAQGEHTLVVKATDPIQEKVESFLNDLRAFAGIVVTIETRFLEVGDYFLRDVGVDWRGLGGQTPGPLVNLDDVTNGLVNGASAGYDNGGGGLTTGAALNPSSGVYFSDGHEGDIRARTENIFNNSLGTVLSSLGGASFTFSYLDDTDISMILRATQKSALAKSLTAPKITVFNTQRANLTVVNQLSYIQDFDVEVAQTSFIADPIVGIIQDGLTLDVRPTVSNDRRYITLELQPTVAKLSQPIPTFATTLASSFTPVIIQLPELRLQQARVTVRIPDRGSILIGGLKNITTVDRQSSTPWLANVPILSFFFSRKGRSDEVTHLMIIVRAEITDLHEQEQSVMGTTGGPGERVALPPTPFHMDALPPNPCEVTTPPPPVK